MPIAQAGPDQQVTLSAGAASTVLDGSAPRDAQGSALSFAWRQLSGPSNSVIVAPQLARSVVTGLVAGIYAFELQVVDRSGVSARDTVVVTVHRAANTPPIANAGPDIHLLLSASSGAAWLDGSASRDPDGALVGYQWRKLSGASAAVIGTPNGVQTVVSGLQPGVYQFELSVTDDTGATSRDSATVTVQSAPNRAPVADAGADQQVVLSGVNGAHVQLDGSGSHDPDGALVGFAWKFVAGPSQQVVIVSPNSAKTTVTVLGAGIYSFDLTVTDDRGAMSRDQVLVTAIKADGPAAGPVARAGRDLVLGYPLASATLDGSTSSALSGVLIGYFWQQVGGPAEGRATGHDAPRLKLSGLALGSYRYRLTVTDEQGRRASDEVSVTVKRLASMR